MYATLEPVDNESDDGFDTPPEADVFQPAKAREREPSSHPIAIVEASLPLSTFNGEAQLRTSTSWRVDCADRTPRQEAISRAGTTTRNDGNTTDPKNSNKTQGALTKIFVDDVNDADSSVEGFEFANAIVEESANTRPLHTRVLVPRILLKKTAQAVARSAIPPPPPPEQPPQPPSDFFLEEPPLVVERREEDKEKLKPKTGGLLSGYSDCSDDEQFQEGEAELTAAAQELAVNSGAGYFSAVGCDMDEQQHTRVGGMAPRNDQFSVTSAAEPPPTAGVGGEARVIHAAEWQKAGEFDPEEVKKLTKPQQKSGQMFDRVARTRHQLSYLGEVAREVADEVAERAAKSKERRKAHAQKYGWFR